MGRNRLSLFLLNNLQQAQLVQNVIIKYRIKNLNISKSPHKTKHMVVIYWTLYQYNKSVTYFKLKTNKKSQTTNKNQQKKHTLYQQKIKIQSLIMAKLQFGHSCCTPLSNSATEIITRRKLLTMKVTYTLFRYVYIFICNTVCG